MFPDRSGRIGVHLLKSILPVLFFVLMLSLVSQPLWSEDDLSGTVGGTLGGTSLDGVNYFEMAIQPEISFGKVGVGLNILLRFDENGNIRDEDWKTRNDYLRIVDYIRYGHKGDPLYLRLGALRGTTFANGFIVYDYSNQVNYDDRLTGLEMAVNRTWGGVEWFDSNLGMIDIFGVRFYSRPFSEIENIPLIDRFVVGASLVNDFRPGEKDNLTEMGVDTGLPLIENSFYDMRLYTEFASIVDYGSGVCIGVASDINVIENVLTMGARLEERWLGDGFIAQNFNRFYEVERMNKFAVLDTVSATSGLFGELTGNLFGIVEITGNYEQYKGRKGYAHLDGIVDATEQIDLTGYFDRRDMDDLGCLFKKFDDDVIMGLEIGYRLSGPLYLVVTRERSFRENEEGSFDPYDRTFIRLGFKYDI